MGTEISSTVTPSAAEATSGLASTTANSSARVLATSGVSVAMCAVTRTLAACTSNVTLSTVVLESAATSAEKADASKDARS